MAEVRTVSCLNYNMKAGSSSFSVLVALPASEGKKEIFICLFICQFQVSLPAQGLIMSATPISPEELEELKEAFAKIGKMQLSFPLVFLMKEGAVGRWGCKR